MLVYANSLILNPPDGANSIILHFWEWLREKNRSIIDLRVLTSGTLNYWLSMGATISSFATVDDDGSPVYPYFFHASFSHPDSKVTGRRWVTEIGLRQYSESDNVYCSFALSTSESSAMAYRKFPVTCPRIFRRIAEECNPTKETVGLRSYPLSDKAAISFVETVVLEPKRSYPLVLLGHGVSEKFGVTSKDIKGMIIGLARLVTFKTAESEQIFSDRLPNCPVSPNTIRVIFPEDNSSYEGLPRSSIIGGLSNDKVARGKSRIVSSVLSEITSYTNERKHREHITAERVKEEKIGKNMERVLSAMKDVKEILDNVDNTEEYEELLEEARIELKKKVEENEALNKSLLAAHAKLDRAESERRANSLMSSDTSPMSLTEAIHDLGMEKVSLGQALWLATSVLHPTRFTVLESAIKSARESDKRGFQSGTKAFGLLLKLGERYWEMLASGEGDQKAKTVFGKSEFAPKDKDTLSDAGRERRTFVYKKKKIFMERHLRLGWKPSLAETLRVHFHWDEEEKKIVIGHCGKHLNF